MLIVWPKRRGNGYGVDGGVLKDYVGKGLAMAGGRVL
jgi:hypothetical protein